MTISAILIAVIALMSFIPYVGYITIPGTPISICTIHIVVILAALLFGWKQGLVAGLAFGLLSLIMAATMPKAPSDVLFVNPLVSVFPRALFGLVAGLLFDAAKKIKNIGGRSIVYVVICVFATFLHTCLVLFMLWVFNREAFGDPFLLIMSVLFTVNGLIEITSAAILVPIVAIPVGHAKQKYNVYASYDAKNEKEIVIKVKGDVEEVEVKENEK